MTTSNLKLEIKKNTSNLPLLTIFKTYNGTFEMNTPIGVRVYKTLAAAEQMKAYCQKLAECAKF